MGAIGLASRGAKAVRPLLVAVNAADSLSQDGGEIAVLPGDPAATLRLRQILGTPAPAASEDALAVAALTPGSELAGPVSALAHRRRSGGGALAVLVGHTPEREALERRVLEGHRLELSNVAHVPALDDAGADAVIEAVIAALGDDLIAAGRRNPGLRPAIGRLLVDRASRRAAAIGALPLPGVDMPVLALLQVRLAAELAALHDRPFGAERVAEAAAIVGAGFGWRAIGRSASSFVPVAGWAVRGAVAYSATRAIGEAALTRLAAGHDLIEGPPIDSARPLIDRVSAKLRR